MIDPKRIKRLEAYQRAEYHVWAALRCSTPGGRDPLTGRTWNETFGPVHMSLFNPQHKRFVRAHHKAQARFWLAEIQHF